MRKRQGAILGIPMMIAGLVIAFVIIVAGVQYLTIAKEGLCWGNAINAVKTLVTDMTAIQPGASLEKTVTLGSCVNSMVFLNEGDSDFNQFILQYCPATSSRYIIAVPGEEGLFRRIWNAATKDLSPLERAWELKEKKPYCAGLFRPEYQFRQHVFGLDGPEGNDDISYCIAIHRDSGQTFWIDPPRTGACSG